MTFLHRWDVTPKEAIQIQRELGMAVAVVDLPQMPKTIAGVDVSLDRFGTELFAGIAVFSFPELEQIDYAVIKTEAAFPYLPGLLSFREVPGLLACFKKLKIKPELLIVDGQGIAHPRRLGIASHLGILLDIPTIGCAKSKLYGSYQEPTEIGGVSPILDPKNGERIGAVIKSKIRSRPIVISPGHKITVDQSVAIIKECLRGYRLPEPTRVAHQMVNAFRTGMFLEE